MEIVINFLIQTAFTVGIIFLFGLFIALCRRGFCRTIGRKGPLLLVITGAVGTPIHELSHALMCLVFGHRVDEIKLYRPAANDGNLGYVKHSYNKKNIYHQIGNFFIGIAPIICGSGVLLLLMRLTVPTVFDEFTSNIGLIAEFSYSDIAFAEIWEIFTILIRAFLAVFDFSNADNVWWWVFLALALMISSHMELSGADIKGGVKGILILMGALLAVDAVLYFVSLPALAAVTSAMVTAGFFLVSFLMIAAFFCVALLIVAWLIRGVMMIFGK
ncbi:MAG: hypothetical protein E7592_00925 [Ruminococcaceae bacterium]|nr:hypothetical protein [Oscillospiraceae bacterium]